MATRVYAAGTSGKVFQQRTSEITPLEPSRAGHVLEVHGDMAIFDTTSGDFVDPTRVKHANGKRGVLGNS